MSRLCIFGSRDFTEFTLLDNEVNNYVQECSIKDGLQIVSGMAKGADSLGIQYSKQYSLPLHEFPANWNMYGKQAGYLRNKSMAEFADYFIGFWDGASKGTQHMINLVRATGKPLKIILIK